MTQDAIRTDYRNEKIVLHEKTALNTLKHSSAPSATESHLAVEMARALQSDVSRKKFLDSVLPELLRMMGGEYGGLVSQRSGAWSREIWVGDETKIPELLIGEALDQGSTRIADGWCVTPLLFESRDSEAKASTLVAPSASALVIRMTQAEQASVSQSPLREDNFKNAASMLATALHRIESRDRHVRRINQLTAVLKAAAEWQRLDDDDALLHRIADTASEPVFSCGTSVDAN
jgi:hypothetical protein